MSLEVIQKSFSHFSCLWSVFNRPCMPVPHEGSSLSSISLYSKFIIWIFSDISEKELVGGCRILWWLWILTFQNYFTSHLSYKTHKKCLASFFLLLPMVAFLPCCFSIRNESHNRSLYSQKCLVNFHFVIIFISSCSHLSDELKKQHKKLNFYKLFICLCC